MTNAVANGSFSPRTRRHMTQAAIKKAAFVTALMGSAQ
jgi:hypothetical protein